MILSFKNQFPDKIIDGIKIHSIREDPGARWKAGRKIHMATGVRTKNYFCFMEDVCWGVQPIEVKHEIFHCEIIETLVWVDRLIIYHRSYEKENGVVTMEKLAKNDGFDSVDDFFKWFDSDFQGQIIHWTDFRY